jgi:hypothetical protein
LESLWAILKEYGKTAGKCSNTCCQPIGEEAELPSGYRQEQTISLHPLKCCMSLYITKNQTHIEHLKKTTSGSSPNYFQSHHITRLKLVRQSLEAG